MVLTLRRPRRTLVFALALILGIFAFESGLHSVHHGFDPKPERCPLAAASQHLTAVTIDETLTAAVALPLVRVAIETTTTAPPARFLRPDQGRAPPSAA